MKFQKFHQLLSQILESKDSSSHREFPFLTFISAGLADIAAAVGVFIKKENVLDPVPVYVFCGQKVVGDCKRKPGVKARPGLPWPLLCTLGFSAG